MVPSSLSLAAVIGRADVASARATTTKKTSLRTKMTKVGRIAMREEEEK
jgi:hypothetical protein